MGKYQIESVSTLLLQVENESICLVSWTTWATGFTVADFAMTFVTTWTLPRITLKFILKCAHFCKKSAVGITNACNVINRPIILPTPNPTLNPSIFHRAILVFIVDELMLLKKPSNGIWKSAEIGIFDIRVEIQCFELYHFRLHSGKIGRFDK